MKMNFRTMAIAAMAAVIGMTSCSKEGEAPEAGDGKTTSVSIVLSEKGESRAVTGPIAETATAVNFKDGYVVFTNGLGIVNKVTRIVPGTYAADASADKEAQKAAGNKVWLDDMKPANMGGEIKNVPAAADKVYIVGNLPTGVNDPAVAENISAVEGRVITAVSQNNAAGNVNDVTLFGGGVTLTAHPNPSVSDAKYAKVDVNAVASRIEIGKVSYSSATGFVTAFQVDGIFVNHYYTEMALAGKTTTALVNNAPADNDAADIVYTTATGGYYTGDIAKLADFKATGIGFKVSATSWSAADPGVTADKNVWTYNVVAPKTADGTTVTELKAPHVVIRLSAITTTGTDPNAAYPGTQYLTVKEFRKAGTSTVIEKFEPGWVYFITELKFDESNLTDVPEKAAVTAYVEASLMNWQRQPVDWGF